MSPKPLKRGFTRRLHKRRHQVKLFGRQADDQLNKHFFNRLNRLPNVGRFVITWGLLFVLTIGVTAIQLEALGGEYQTVRPAPGGIYTEGLLGSFTNANPIYATNEVDTSVSRLIFAGLLKYNDQNKLVGDLADQWSVNKFGTIYTFHLKPHLTWQDGSPLTAKDVVFTYDVIQNPDAQSPLYSSWRGIGIKAVDSRTVVFTLPDPLSSFPYNLTTGIIPMHLLKNTPMIDLRSATFNTNDPVGAGPFKWQAVEVSGSTPEDSEEQIALTPFGHYYAGRPKLDGFVIKAFADEQQLIDSFKHNELTAAAGFTNTPTDLTNDKSTIQYNMMLSAATMAFFNNDRGVMSDPNVRRALVAGADTNSILQSLGYVTKRAEEPLLRGQVGFNPAYAQSAYSPRKARLILSKDGWKAGADGILRKNKQKLSINLYAINNDEYSNVAEILQKQWRRLGVQVNVNLQDSNSFHNTLTSHSYDAVLNSISIGVDPDVFVYWDGSETDVQSNGLNFSQYDSPTANISLEAGRTRLGDRLRVIKYAPFLRSWQADAPALALYQPRFLYLTKTDVYGLNEHVLNVDADRFDNVSNWMIRQSAATD